jgi:hypothetical protein
MKVSDTSIYLEAAALEKDTTVTIAGTRPVGSKDIGTDGKPMSEKSMILSYAGAKKEHVACRTVQKQIRALYGNDTANWIGKKITLYQDSCMAFGKRVQCIRVRNINPETGRAPEAF